MHLLQLLHDHLLGEAPQERGRKFSAGSGRHRRSPWVLTAFASFGLMFPNHQSTQEDQSVTNRRPLVTHPTQNNQTTSSSRSGRPARTHSFILSFSCRRNSRLQRMHMAKILPAVHISFRMHSHS